MVTVRKVSLVSGQIVSYSFVENTVIPLVTCLTLVLSNKLCLDYLTL